MKNAEAIEFLKNMIDRESVGFVCPQGSGDVAILQYHVEALNMAISALEKQEGKKPITVETNIYDQEEIHHGCIVQVLRNSVTGDVSVGWWKEKKGEE